MKKVLLTITGLVLLIVGVAGFMFITDSNNSKAAKQPYNIEKIVIGTHKDYLMELKAYERFSIGLLKAFAEEYNIPVEEKSFETLDDVTVALQRGDINVTIGITSIGIKFPELVKTYSYHTGALYKHDTGSYNPEIVVSKDSYSFAVNKDDKELTDFLNDMIVKFKDNGKMKEIRQKYLGDRAEL